MKASVITIGEELLIGQVINTNSSWISEQLTLAGIRVIQHIAVADHADDIRNALEIAQTKSDLLILTGGLGPTKDDITKKTLAAYFNTTLVRSNEVYQHIKQFFATRNIEMGILNEQQADVPANCQVLHNAMGTAPGMWFEQDNKIIISLPGVPYEMKYIVSNEILPRLAKKVDQHIQYKTLLTSGLPESEMAKLLFDFESNLPDGISLAYLPSPGQLRLRLTAIGKNREDVQQQFNKSFQHLEAIAEKYVTGYDLDTLPGIVARLLTERHKTLSTAESCTGGRITAMLTEIPGASAFLTGGIIAYSYAIKEQELNIPARMLEELGAVSEEVVKQMAWEVQQKYGTDFSLAVSGIAGPAGGTSQKPVGTVWIAVANDQKQVEARVFHFGDNRELNIQRASMNALNMLRLAILKK